jgi:hypothetical protein
MFLPLSRKENPMSTVLNEMIAWAPLATFLALLLKICITTTAIALRTVVLYSQEFDQQDVGIFKKTAIDNAITSIALVACIAVSAFWAVAWQAIPAST